MDLALGRSRPGKNKDMARHVRRMWRAEEGRRGGQLWAVHVPGHSGHVWNERADRAAARGAEGYVRGIGERWAAWPPLLGRVARAHEIDETQRVLRAQHAFGVLAIPVPVHGAVITEGRVRARLRRVEERLDRTRGAREEVERARARAREAYELLRVPTQQRAEAGRLIHAGLQPVTSVVECPINVGALRRYVRGAGAEKDVVQYDSRGRARGTLRELARDFLERLGARETAQLTYRHSLLGAELVAAGLVVASREMVYGAAADPFRLPRALRSVALARRGRDMDDSASYPRACFDVFQAGAAAAREFLAHREEILAGVGRHYFGAAMPVATRRKKAKDLFNAMDNDGTVYGWLRREGMPTDIPHARFAVGHEGRVFDLDAYERSRADMTAEFQALMPGMCEFVADWLREHRDARVHTHERTAKSCFLQEAEGLSRRAKVAWAARRGDLAVTNLQHDGVVLVLPDGMDPAEAEAALAEASSRVLGYEQPVEEKPMGDGGDGSESEAEEVVADDTRRDDGGSS